MGSYLPTGSRHPEFSASGGKLHLAEEIFDLKRRRFRCVGAVNAVLFEIDRKFLADRACIRIRGIRDPHEFAPRCDGIVLPEHHGYAGSRTHIGRQIFEEGLSSVHCIESFGLFFREPQFFHRDNREPVILNSGQYFPCYISTHCVRLDDGKSFFHQFLLEKNLFLQKYILTNKARIKKGEEWLLAHWLSKTAENHAWCAAAAMRP
jgi:hypothetical protein